MNIQQRKKIGWAAALAAAGCAVLAILALIQSVPDPAEWLTFAAVFVFLEWRSRLVEQGLGVSPTVMVVFTAAVVFGPQSAVLGTVAMEVLGSFRSEDFHQRRWFQPLANLGQLTISAAVGVPVLLIIMPETIASSNLWRVAVGSACGAAVYGLVNFSIVSSVVRSVYGRRAGSEVSFADLHIPYIAMGSLGGLLGAVYVLTGVVSLPLILIVFFVGHLTVSSFAELREAQRATLSGFMKTLEAKDLYARGRTERIAELSTEVARRAGHSKRARDRLRWAALVLDVTRLGVPNEIYRKRSPLTGEERATMQNRQHAVETLLAEVDFLEPIVELVRNRRSPDPGAQSGATPGLPAILAVVEAFEALTSPRAFRSALTQEAAFSELDRCSGEQFEAAAVRALIETIVSEGRRYGAEPASRYERRAAADRGWEPA